MASPDDVFIFRLDIIEGKDFGFDVQALRCSIVFGGERKDTPFSVAKDKHIWNFTLEWRATRQQIRALQASGKSQCKITVLKKDQEKSLGWVLLDTRKAKLNSVHNDQEGKIEI
jgi:centrosomal protein CEP120